MGFLAAFLACLLLLQNPAELFQKAPPAVDEALRARVTAFFQAHVDGKFRAAEQMVAEDSKDAFYTASKPRYHSFEIAKIDYSESFTRAQVTVTCEMDHPAPGFAGTKVKAPRVTTWKLDGGQWSYYIDPNQGYRTPLGIMKPGPGQSAGLPPGVTPGVTPPAPKVDIKALLSWVKVDKAELAFSREKPGSREVTLSNRGSGTVTLVLTVPPMPGFEVTLDRQELKPGETARLTATWKPGEIPPPPRIRIQLLVQPVQQVLDVWAVFADK